MSAEFRNDKHLEERAREGCDEIAKAASIGILFVSPEARARLEKLLPDLASATLPDSYGALERVRIAIDMCIRDLCPIAKADLKVNE